MSAARAERRFALIVLAAFLAADGVIIAGTIATWSGMVPDFFAFWSTARFLATHSAAEAYDLIALASFQHSLLERFTAAYPAPYSPAFLLAIRPLAWLSYPGAHLAWIGVTAAGFLFAARALLAHPAWLLALCLSPAVVLNAVYGQTGFLSAALMLGAILLMRLRPWAAGVCLALLAFKPQLGLLMPVMLLVRRDGRSILAALVWLAGLIALSSFVLGWSIWLDWLKTLSSHATLIAETQHQLLPIMATLAAGARMLGAGPVLAQVFQILVAIPVVTMVWLAWRRADRDLAAAATLVGTFLVTPYAFTYDLPAAMCGVLLFLQARRRLGPTLSGIELGASVFALLAPLFILADTPRVPMVPLSLLAMFAVIARSVWVHDRNQGRTSN